MRKKMLVVWLLMLVFPIVCYGEDIEEPATESSFNALNALNDLTSRYARKQVLDGTTTSVKKKKAEVYLEFPFDNSPYVAFSTFLLNGPTHHYSGFIETIYYRDKIKIKDMYYEKNPVKTDKIGIYSTDLCFTSNEGVIYHYKNVPYLVSSDQMTIFFSEVDFNKEHKKISGKIKMPASKNTYQIELFYTDNDEYHYQETTADKNGVFSLSLNREGIEGKMYLRSSDGLGNYANACDIDKTGMIGYPVPREALKAIEASYKQNTKKETSVVKIVITIVSRMLLVILFILVLLRLRVIIKRRQRRKRVK